MILQKGHSLNYLQDWRDGKIPMGKGLGVQLVDNHVRHKDNELYFILALDNLGKTHFMLWYFLCLSLKYGIIHDICAMENKPGSSMRRLIQMKADKKVEMMSDDELFKHHEWVDRHFNFLDHELMYSHKELFKIFAESNSHSCFIDPYTGLKRDYGHVGNYEFLHDSREFVNTKKTLYTSLHTRTEATGRIYPKGHDLEGYIMPPFKGLCEGGQPFANRADNFYVLHRHPNHPQYKYTTELHVQKIKETETGGEQTLVGHPLMFDFNSGYGFTFQNRNILKEIHEQEVYRKEQKKAEQEKDQDDDWFNNTNDDLTF
jgi:hypothetical protein